MFRLFTLLVLTCLPVMAQAERDLRVFFFGADTLVQPQGGGAAAVPYWLGQMAAAAGSTLTADGTAGSPADIARSLPPQPLWQFDGVPRAMTDNPRSFRMAGFDTVVLALPQDAPAAGADSDMMVADLAGRIIDWTGNQTAARFFLYDGWAGADTALTPDDWQDWLALNAGDHAAWHRNLADLVRARVPQADVTVIPVAATFARLLAEGGVLADLAPADLFAGTGPQGTPSAYLIAAMTTYAALYAEPPPVIALPDTIHPALRDRYAAMSAAVWQVATGAVAPPLTAAPLPPVPGAADVTDTGLPDPSIAFGLNGLTDWTAQQPFLNVMRTARPWLGHTAAQWGAVSFDDLRAGGFLGPDGWPLAIPDGVTALEALILTDQAPEATSLAGTYVLRWKGDGTITVGGLAQETARGEREVRFDYTPGPGLVAVGISALDPADPIRDITVVHERHLALFDAGAVFNPDWLAVIADARVLRFMDWMQTNGSPLVTWADRPQVTDFSYAWRGVPVEVMVDLANRVGADPWFTLPHMADDAHVSAFAALVRDRLDPRLIVHAEWSNETWNFTFPQTHWAAEQARLRWGADGGDAWMQFAGTRAAEVADLWGAAFAGQEHRLIRIVAPQTGWLGLEEPLLDAPLRVAEGLPPPAQSFDAYAVTGYFGFEMGDEQLSGHLRAWIADGTATARVTERLRAGSFHQLVTELWPYHAQVAAARGLTLMMYEGGTHVVGLGPVTEDEVITGFMTAYNYSPEMAALYADLLTAWRALGGPEAVGPFNAFVDVAGPSRWGSWGALRHLDDVNPRWATLAAWNALPFGDTSRAPGTFLQGVTLTGAGEVTGTPQADVLIGSPGDDVIMSQGGDDRIAAGDGTDRVILPGTPADWSPSYEGDALWLDAVGDAVRGSVRITGAEEIVFSDASDAPMTLGPLPASAEDQE